jgi:hexosaminidase
MKNLVLILLSVIWIPCRAQNHPTLLPQPQQIRYGADQLKLTELSIYLPFQSREEDIFSAGELSSYLKSRTGINIPVSHKKMGKQIIITHGNLPSLPGLNEVTGPEGREAYTMKIDGKGIYINGKSSAGAFYAVQTLRQMAEGSGESAFFPEAEITDYPALPYQRYHR